MSQHKLLMDMKIIRYRPDLEGLQIASGKTLLWPCHAFSLAVPVGRQDRLNLFERTILRLACAGRRGSAELERLTGMPGQIISAIQSRLVQLNYLDETFAPRDGVTGMPGEETEAIEEESCTVFVELISGRLLPFILQGSPRFAQDVRKRGSFDVEFCSGTAGNPRLRHGRCLEAEPEHVGHRPSAQDLQTLMGVHLRRQRYRPMELGARGAACVSSRGASLVFSPEPQRAWLSVECVLQRGNFEPLLTDPFGHGFSGLFDDSFRRLCRRDPEISRWLDGVFEKAQIKQARAQHSLEPPRADNRLTRCLNDADWALRQTQVEVRSNESERKHQQSIAKFVAALYGAVEQGLHAVLQSAWPDQGRLGLLIEGDYRSNASLLVGVAQKLGFELHSQPARVLLEVAGGKFQPERPAATVELQPLLSLCLIAADADRDHPLRRLAVTDPGWIEFMAGLKVRRDRAQHGAGLDLVFSSAALPGHDARVRASLAYLLPHIQLSSLDKETRHDRLDDRSRAYVEIVRHLGASRLGELSVTLRENLIALELERPGSDDPTAAQAAVECSAMITGMAALLQIQLQKAQAGATHYELQEAGEGRSCLAEKARAVGFEVPQAGLPKGLATVARRQYQNAAIGRAATLGAQMLTFLLRLPHTQLNDCALKMPWLLLFASDLCELRRHGNDDVFLSTTELGIKMDRTYAVIRHFMEF